MMYWIITALSLIGVVLNIKRRRSCFYVWIITNTAWCVADFQAGLYAQSFLFVVYLALSIWGWFAWKKDEPPRHEDTKEVLKADG